MKEWLLAIILILCISAIDDIELYVKQIAIENGYAYLWRH